MSTFSVRNLCVSLATCSLTLTLFNSAALADGGITYTDIAATPSSSGLAYDRTPSMRDSIFEQIKAQPQYDLSTDLVVTPLKSRGAPGIAVFDYDGDGDQDIYVTNGPGTPNSLFENQLTQTGQPTFIDAGSYASADLTAQDSNGVCVGDIDNDGDEDLYVLGSMEPNRLLENQGDGTFVDITVASHAGAGSFEAVSCTMVDINNNGKLDIFIGNTFDMTAQFAIFAEPFLFNQTNQLLRNDGHNQFSDVSATSGVTITEGFNPASTSQPTITWAVTAFDYDGDGDQDLIQMDDQAAIPFSIFGVPGFQDRGFIQIFQNDGHGHFENMTEEAGTNVANQWMGVSVGDINCDGDIDLFGSTFGDYAALGFAPDYPNGLSPSRFITNNGDGTFSDTGTSIIGAGGIGVFGWGTSMFDYDNDGDLDVIYHGGMDLGPYVDASNPGVVLQNQGQCSGTFEFDAAATSATDHLLRIVHGVAVGDINNDGFDDIISVSNANTPNTLFPLLPYPTGAQSTPFSAAGFIPTFFPTSSPGMLTYGGVRMPNGTLSVELSSGNANHSVQVTAMGTADILPHSCVNRSGIGAVVSFTPRHGQTVTRPVTGGSSYASTDSKVLTFGLGQKNKGDVEITWSGNVRNKLYNVKKGSRVRIPEIPCSYDDASLSSFGYTYCVASSLRKLERAGEITRHEKFRLYSSALRARREYSRNGH